MGFFGLFYRMCANSFSSRMSQYRRIAHDTYRVDQEGYISIAKSPAIIPAPIFTDRCTSISPFRNPKQRRRAVRSPGRRPTGCSRTSHGAPSGTPSGAPSGTTSGAPSGTSSNSPPRRHLRITLFLRYFPAGGRHSDRPRVSLILLYVSKT